MPMNDITQKAILSITFIFVLAGCTPKSPDPSIIQTAISQTQTAQPTVTPLPTSTPIPTAIIPDSIKIQALNLLAAGDKLDAAGEQGITYLELRQKVSDAQGYLSLIESLWPAERSKESLMQFDKAFECWNLTIDLWYLKINDKDNPLEPDINGYLNYVEHGEGKLIIDVHPNDFIVKAYQGMKYLPFDENISIFLTLASNHYQQGKTELLKEIK